MNSEAYDVIRLVPDELKGHFFEQEALWMRSIAATCLSQLGMMHEAIEFFEEIINDTVFSTLPDFAQGAILLESGRAYASNNQSSNAENQWSRAAALFRSAGDKGHLARAEANLALLKLKSPDLDIQRQAEDKIHRAITEKAAAGDVSGVANSYCILANYYHAQKKWERAIAYHRKDLQISRQIGDRRGLASTLGNLAMVYAKCLQLTPARQLLFEASRIGCQINDYRLQAIVRAQLAEVNRIGAQAGKSGQRIGPKALCVCGGGKTFGECCGLGRAQK